MLARSVDAVVEDCVNSVGVEVNTASVPLLARVSGISGVLAENIVLHRDTNGPFKSRRELKTVARLGPKAYEQCAGFLRIADGDDPLDSSSVHPEAYSVVRKILARTGGGVGDLIGNTAVLRGLSPAAFVDDTFGLPTVTDIIAELEKPGRDPTAGVRHRQLRRRCREDRLTCGSAWCWRESSPTSRPSVPSSTSGCTRTVWSMCRRCRRSSSATRARW